MDLSEKSTTTTTMTRADPDPPSLAVSALDHDHCDDQEVDNQFHSPARSVTSSMTSSHDGSDATSAVGVVSGLESSDVARSQNQV